MADIVQLVENGVKKFLKTHVKAVEGLYPVGAIYTSVNSTNPATLFGGTWERYAQGKVLVGINENDPDFIAGKTGGDKNVTLTNDQIPAHKHTFSGTTGGSSVVAGNDKGDVKFSQTGTAGWGIKSAVHTHGFSGTTNAIGGNKPHNNLQPYTTVYMWVRTA